MNFDGNSYHNCTFVINSPDVHGQNSILQGIPHGIPGWPNNMSQWQNTNPFVQLRTPGYYNNVQNMSQQHQNNHFMGIPRQHPNRQSTSTMYTYQHSFTQEPNYNRQSQTPTTNHIDPYNMNQTRQYQEPDIWGGIDDAALINIDAEVQQSTQAHFNTVRIRELIPTNVINIPGNSVRTNNFNSLQNTNAEEDMWGGLTD